jgi:hypothetical protein
MEQESTLQKILQQQVGIEDTGATTIRELLGWGEAGSILSLRGKMSSEF